MYIKNGEEWSLTPTKFTALSVQKEHRDLVLEKIASVKCYEPGDSDGEVFKPIERFSETTYYFSDWIVFNVENGLVTGCETQQLGPEDIAVLCPQMSQIDLDRIQIGVTDSSRKDIQMVKKIIKELETIHGDQIEESHIVADAVNIGIEPKRVDELIYKLKLDGDIFSPKRGFIQWVTY